MEERNGQLHGESSNIDVMLTRATLSSSQYSSPVAGSAHLAGGSSCTLSPSRHHLRLWHLHVETGHGFTPLKLTPPELKTTILTANA